jgi:hypothetical protein
MVQTQSPPPSPASPPPADSPTSKSVANDVSRPDEGLIDVLDECLVVMLNLLSSATGKSPEQLQAEIDLIPEGDLESSEAGKCDARPQRSRRSERKKKRTMRTRAGGLRRQMDYFEESKL